MLAFIDYLVFNQHSFITGCALKWPTASIARTYIEASDGFKLFIAAYLEGSQLDGTVMVIMGCNAIHC
jgi:hypothetical protein